MTVGSSAVIGEVNYTKLLETAENNSHRVAQTPSNLTGNSTTSIAIADAGDGRFVQVRVEGVGTGMAYANFDPSTGAVTASGGSSLVSTSISPLTGGGYLAVFQVNHGSAYGISVGAVTTAAAIETEAYVGDAAKGIYVGYCQTETGSTATTYRKTEAIAGRALVVA
jgi:hypothetical protein